MADRHSEHGQQMPASVYYDQETGRITVVLAMTDDAPPAEVWIDKVDIELLYPEGSENWGERSFRNNI